MTDLSPEQIRGADFLRARRVAGLFDGPGYGKTAQFIRAGDLSGARRILTVCPPNVPTSERDQYDRWSVLNLPFNVMKAGADDLPKWGVVCLTYALAGRPEVVKKLRKWKADVLNLDESHHLKDPQGARTRKMFNADGIAATCGAIHFITGSPTPNNASELFVFAKVSGAWKGTFNQFIDRYCICADSHFGRKIIGTNEERRAELRAMLEPFALARQGIEDGRSALTLDSITVEGEAPDYSEIDADNLSAIKEAASAGNWGLLDGPAVATVDRITGIAKAKGVAALAKTAIDAGHKQILIFAAHTSVIDVMAAELADFNVGVIDGRTSNQLAERIVSDFEPGIGKPPPHFQIAICQRQALKEGRTMTGATRVIIAEPFWTPEYNWQMICRAWRRGQTKPVHASFAHLSGSIDEAKARGNARKTADIAGLKIGLAA